MPDTSAMARLRCKRQITIPEEARHALHAEQGDLIQFIPVGDGSVIMRAYALVPAPRVRKKPGD